MPQSAEHDVLKCRSPFQADVLRNTCPLQNKLACAIADSGTLVLSNEHRLYACLKPKCRANL